ncbi:MAG: RNA methyltransferase [Bauldia sp.]
MPDIAEPAIILVETQLAENIGTTARAMANFGLGELRLVAPRQWPHEMAHRAASGADFVLDAAKVYPTLRDAIADLHFVFASTARPREMSKPVRGPNEAARFMRSEAVRGVRSGVIFGRERIGLTNDEISLADEILTLPIDPRHASLNIAQAVLIVAYEWRRTAAEESAQLPFGTEAPEPPAAKIELLRLFEHLEGALDAAGFFRPLQKRPHMVEALRSILQRAGMTDQEVRSFRGVVAALQRRPTRPHIGPDGAMTTERGPDE